MCHITIRTILVQGTIFHLNYIHRRKKQKITELYIIFVGLFSFITNVHPKFFDQPTYHNGTTRREFDDIFHHILSLVIWISSSTLGIFTTLAYVITMHVAIRD